MINYTFRINDIKLLTFFFQVIAIEGSRELNREKQENSPTLLLKSFLKKSVKNSASLTFRLIVFYVKITH